MGKQLGQHFLKNKRKIRKIVDALELQNGDAIVEIGPGNGTLMKEMSQRNKELRIIGIEKDKELVNKLLSSKFIRNTNIEIIEGDILKILPKLTQLENLRACPCVAYNKEGGEMNIPKVYLFPPTDEIASFAYKLVGNIPYYITGRLFRILGEVEKKPKLIILTIQKEVAERLVVKPPNMNILGASVQVWGDVKIIEQIPKEDFEPVPKVDSAVVKIVPRKNKIPKGYYQLVKILFRHPRKTILNNLSIGLEKEVVSKKIKDVGFDPKIRPQNLSIENIKKLAEVLLSKNDQSVH